MEWVFVGWYKALDLPENWIIWQWSFNIPNTYVKQQNVIMNKNLIFLLITMDILLVYRTLAERGKES